MKDRGEKKKLNIWYICIDVYIKVCVILSCCTEVREKYVHINRNAYTCINITFLFIQKVFDGENQRGKIFFFSERSEEEEI